MRPADFFRECAVDVAGAYPFSAMTTWVMVGLNHLLAPYKVSSFTFPFVLITWFVLLAARIMHGLPHGSLGTPGLPGSFSSSLDLSFVNLLVYWLRGISQVFLVNSWVTGLLFFYRFGY